MKTFIEKIIEWKSAAALMFSGSIVLCVVIFFIIGETAIPLSVIFPLLILSSAGTFLQYLSFTDRIIKKMRYTARLAVFSIPFLLLLAVNAWFFHWFADTTYWLFFNGIFLVVFIGGTVAFEIYFNLTGKKYDGLLGQYRKHRDAGGA
jgi:hypothetical protein